MESNPYAILLAKIEEASLKAKAMTSPIQPKAPHTSRHKRERRPLSTGHIRRLTRTLANTSNILRKYGQFERSLEVAKLIQALAPSSAEGFKRECQDLINLRAYDKAAYKSAHYLPRFSASRDFQTCLLVSSLAIGNDAYIRLALNEVCTFNTSINKYLLRRALDRLLLFSPELAMDIYQKSMQSTSIRESDIAGLIENFEQLDDLTGMLEDSMTFLQSLAIKSFVPIGDNCCTAQLLSDCNLRNYSLPFDWLFCPGRIALKCIQNSFNDFLDPRYLESAFPDRRCGHLLYKKGNFFNHHDPTREPDASSYSRRVRRIKDLLKSDSACAFINIGSSLADLREIAASIPAHHIVIGLSVEHDAGSKPDLVCTIDANLVAFRLKGNAADSRFAKATKDVNKYIVNGSQIEFHLFRLLAKKVLFSFSAYQSLHTLS